jgi:hypothetical protein
VRRDRIFISYRRSDVPDAVSWLRSALRVHFGEASIFQDTAAIRPGDAFPARLRDELARAAFLLVVIGPHWNQDEHGVARLTDSADWVRAEVETGLADGDVVVIPLLVDRTPMPKRESLPESLQALADRNAIPLSITQGGDLEPLVSRLSERIARTDAAGEAGALRLAVQDVLASVVAAHLWGLWEVLVPHRDEPELVFEPPAGFHDGDLLEVHRVLQWLSDVAGADRGWWRDARILVTADAAAWVASDLTDRLRPRDAADAELGAVADSVHEARRGAVLGLKEIAERQQALADRDKALETMGFLRALYETAPLRSYMVLLDAYIRCDDGVDIIGDRPFEFLRAEVSWITDVLRPDSIDLDDFGEPIAPDPPPAAVYRWGRLLGSQDDEATIWETRFADESWFRAVMRRSHDEYPSGQLGSFFEGSSPG